MSRYDNPFDAGDSNPFSNAPGKGKSAPAPTYSNLGGATGSYYDKTADAPAVSIPMETISPLEKREIEAREANLRRQAEELRLREAALVANHKNWPPFFPIIHHDIANDIPSAAQGIMRVAFWSWLGMILCLLFNIISVLAGWVTSSVTYGPVSFVLALVYFILGVPISYFIWYKPLYTAIQRSGPISYTIFFICYVIHIAYCIFAFIGPKFHIFHARPFTGLLITLELFSESYIAVGIVFLIGTVLYGLEVLLGVYVLQGVYRYFRGRA